MYWYTSIVKMENDEFENVRIENCTSYSFDEIIKLEDFDIDSIKRWKIKRKILHGPEKYDASYKRIGCLISLKSEITYIFPYYRANINVDSYDSLPIEKTL